MKLQQTYLVDWLLNPEAIDSNNVPLPEWILTTGFWEDSAFWLDSGIWVDGEAEITSGFSTGFNFGFGD